MGERDPYLIAKRYIGTRWVRRDAFGQETRTVFDCEMGGSIHYRSGRPLYAYRCSLDEWLRWVKRARPTTDKEK